MRFVFCLDLRCFFHALHPKAHHRFPQLIHFVIVLCFFLFLRIFPNEQGCLCKGFSGSAGCSLSFPCTVMGIGFGKVLELAPVLIKIPVALRFCGIQSLILEIVQGPFFISRILHAAIQLFQQMFRIVIVIPVINVRQVVILYHRITQLLRQRLLVFVNAEYFTMSFFALLEIIFKLSHRILLSPWISCLSYYTMKSLLWRLF